MSNGNVIRMPQQQVMPAAQAGMVQPTSSVGQPQMFWDGTQWCFFPPGSFDPCGNMPPFPCPPPGCPPQGCPPWFPPPQAQPPWYPGANAGVSFGPTAPPNVIRGHFWWDGITLRMFDGAVWVVVGGAPATTNTFAISQPGFNPIATAWAVFQFSASPMIDIFGGWNRSAFRYTPTQAGVYMFEAATWQAGTSGGIAIVKNDPGTFTDSTSDNVVGIFTTTAQGHMKVNGITDMNGTSDYIRLWAFSQAGQIWGANEPPMLDAWKMA